MNESSFRSPNREQLKVQREVLVPREQSSTVEISLRSSNEQVGEFTQDLIRSLCNDSEGGSVSLDERKLTVTIVADAFFSQDDLLNQMTEIETSAHTSVQTERARKEGENRNRDETTSSVLSSVVDELNLRARGYFLGEHVQDERGTLTKKEADANAIAVVIEEVAIVTKLFTGVSFYTDLFVRGAQEIFIKPQERRAILETLKKESETSSSFQKQCAEQYKALVTRLLSSEHLTPEEMTSALDELRQVMFETYREQQTVDVLVLNRVEEILERHIQPRITVKDLAVSAAKTALVTSTLPISGALYLKSLYKLIKLGIKVHGTVKKMDARVGKIRDIYARHETHPTSELAAAA